VYKGAQCVWRRSCYQLLAISVETQNSIILTRDSSFPAHQIKKRTIIFQNENIYPHFNILLTCRGENGTDYFRPTDRPKAYGTQKRIRSDSWRIRSRIRLVINGYRKGYGFTNIRPYPKIYHISRLYPDNIRQNIR
jgi:hypothetical protein